MEAPIQVLQDLLSSGAITSTELCALFLHRISTYDTRGPFLNSIPLLNPKLFAEAAASDARRASGQSLGPLDGIPYTLKDSYKYLGMTVASGCAAFSHLQPNEDAFLARKLKEAGAIMIGKTNMPPMAAGGMQRGLYGRAESPYNAEYLTAAFSSGSSNGSATSTAASFAAFGLGSETVSSGRSPASNNGLVCYTPSKGFLSCRGLWPLYVTCDVPVPHTRTVKDMLTLLDILAQPDSEVEGDFWREQTTVNLPKVSIPKEGFASLSFEGCLKGKRLAVPKMYIGGKDSNPHAKYTVVSEDVKHLWKRARADLEALGATIIETDFPLVTNYEDDSTGHHNNVTGAPIDWNVKERSDIISYAWDDFLIQNKDKKHVDFGDLNPDLIFPLPQGFAPSHYAEVKNMIDYPELVNFVKHGKRQGETIHDIPGMFTMLKALEAQRKRDLDDWLDAQNLDAVVFPANGDVGRADLETNFASAQHALQNGVKYSNGNRAIRHLGVPTVSVAMGVMESRKMPVNLTFCGRAGEDAQLLGLAYTYEQGSRRRVAPPRTPALPTESIPLISGKSSRQAALQNVELTVTHSAKEVDGSNICVSGTVSPASARLSVFVDGVAVDEELVQVDEAGKYQLRAPFTPFDVGQVSYAKYDGGDVLANKVMVVLLARTAEGAVKGDLVLL